MTPQRFLDVLINSLLENGADKYAVLKGGFLLSKLLRTRGTKDIDFTTESMDSWNKLSEIFEQTALQLQSQGVVTTWEVVNPDQIKHTSGRVFFYDMDTVANIDVSIQDTQFGTTSVCLPLVLDLNPVVVPITAYTFERVLGDKLSVLWSAKRYRRVKDIFDIYCIISSSSIDMEKLHESLEKRKVDFSVYDQPFDDESMQRLLHAWNKFTIERLEGASITRKPDMEELLRAINEFVQGYLDISEDATDLRYVWSPKNEVWESALFK